MPNSDDIDVLIVAAEERLTDFESHDRAAEPRDRILEVSGIQRPEAEARVLRAKTDAKFAIADAEIAAAESIAERGRKPAMPFLRSLESDAGTPTPNIFYDATLILEWGETTPVGMVRADHYAAEFLARDPSFALQFVIFERGLSAFRALSADEQRTIRELLFHRYQQRDEGIEAAAEPAVTEAMTVDLAELAPNNKDSITSDQDFEQACLSGFGLLRWSVRTAITMSPTNFDRVLVRDASRLMPVKPEDPPFRRAATRLSRLLALQVARGGHAILTSATGLKTAIQHPFRPDFPYKPHVATELVDVVELVPTHNPPTTVAAGITFRPGDVVISMANSWDYMDYAYLHQITANGVRFVAVVYDVIAMMLPYTAPSPANIYHRHWVEMGQTAAKIIAISYFSMITYRRYICEPNDLKPQLSYAHLPNFLKEHADAIGEMPVNGLIGRPFVFFCSTIETRKNHQLLLHLWDRMLEDIELERLPILLFVGKWAWGSAMVRLIVERNWRLRKRLQILDQISDAELIWLYRNARFTVFPSLAEGFGLAVSESLSFGTPVIVANCPALIEASENLMPAIDPLDLPAWLDEVRGLVLDDSRLQALRDAATLYRGPTYEEFGAAIRDAALSVAQSALGADQSDYHTKGGIPTCPRV